MSAMIYENGAWKEADTPKTWNGNAFEDTDGYYWENGTQKEAWGAWPDGYLYYEGKEYPNKGGEWVASKVGPTGAEASNLPTITKYSNYMYARASEQHETGAIYKPLKLNFSLYKHCYIYVINATSGKNAWSNGVRIEFVNSMEADGIRHIMNENVRFPIAVSTSTGAETEVSIAYRLLSCDITNLTGEGYVGVFLMSVGSPGSTACSISFSKLYLTRD